MKLYILEEDEAAMKYEGGPKSMCVYGFVPQNEIKLEYWCGKGSRIIVPQAEVIKLFVFGYSI